jgi:hypothetical protein
MDQIWCAVLAQGTEEYGGNMALSNKTDLKYTMFKISLTLAILGGLD